MLEARVRAVFSIHPRSPYCNHCKRGKFSRPAKIFIVRQVAPFADAAAQRPYLNPCHPRLGFFAGISLSRSVLVAFSKRMPSTLSVVSVATAVSKNIQMGCSRMRRPNQITYG